MKRPNFSVLTEARTRVAALGTVFLILVSAAAGFVGGWAGSRANQKGSFDTSTSKQIISSESELISSIAKDAGPSVVSVNVMGKANRQSFFGIQSVERQSAGTGFIVSGDVIVTNRHVVSDVNGQVSVTLDDGTELTEVEVIGRTSQGDPLDVAFLRVKDTKGKTLKPLKRGDSSKMEVGGKVVAIGNALGQFQNSVTTGIISGYGRSVVAGDETGSSTETLQNLFQTDAAINQGNSGGPLVNVSGEVIGINTAIAGEGAENIGFAIPINDVSALIDSVLAKGKLERPYIGVRYISLTDDYAYEFSLPVKRGAYVAPNSDGETSILPDSPASKAGLKEKDVITKVNGEDVNEKNSLTSLVGKHKVGDEVTLNIFRDGKDQQIKVTLEAAPQQ
ncbi:MAG TPA: trypsin-like peptidase domain-containing protein [Verrucomicrobiae bacterium]|nr:trypsin-like peptidase domain-containing protein [Verrucomicrobiae bacterium]